MKTKTKQPDWENLHYLLTYEIKTSHFKKAPYREYILLDKKLEKKIKSFISKNFISKEELVREIEGMDTTYNWDKKYFPNTKIYSEGYNKALSDLLELIKK